MCDLGAEAAEGGRWVDGFSEGEGVGDMMGVGGGWDLGLGPSGGLEGGVGAGAGGRLGSSSSLSSSSSSSSSLSSSVMGSVMMSAEDLRLGGLDGERNDDDGDDDEFL